MRGPTDRQAVMLSTLPPDQVVPHDHPIRQIKPIVDRALTALSPTFTAMYAEVGRPSIPPEHLLKGSLLIALSGASASSASGFSTTSSSSGSWT